MNRLHPFFVLLFAVASVSAGEAFPGLRERIDAAFAAAPDAYQMERILKRLEAAERLAAQFDEEPLKAGDLAAFRRGFDEELACWQLNPLAPHADPVRLNVRDYGAKGDGRTDDGPAFARAFDAIRSLGGRPSVLEVAAGTYRLATPVGDRSFQLDCGGLSNCTIRGESPRTTRLALACYELSGARLIRSRNLCFRNLEFAYERTPFCQGTVESFDRDAGELVIKRQDGTLSPCDPTFVRRRGGTGLGTVCGVFRPDGTRILGPNLFFKYEAEDLGGDRFRVRLNRVESNWQAVAARHVPVGSAFVIPDRGAGPVISCGGAAWIDFVDVWIRNARSAGIIPYGGRYISGIRYRVFPREGLVLSTNADAFYGCPGTYLAHSELRNMNDDGGNSHMKCCPVIAVADSHTLVHRLHGGAVRVGENVRLYHALDGSVAATLTVAETRFGKWGKYDNVFVTRTLEEIPAGVMTEESVPRKLTAVEWERLNHAQKVDLPPMPDLLFVPQGYGMGYVVTDTVFSDIRNLGVNVQTPHAIIEKSRFVRVNGGITLSGLLNWREGIPPYNVVLRRNAFEDVDVAISSSYRAVGGLSSEKQIYGVTFEGNSFTRVRRAHALGNLRGKIPPEPVSGSNVSR